MSQAAAAIPDGKLIMYFCKFAVLFGHKARRSPATDWDVRGILINLDGKGSRPIALIPTTTDYTMAQTQQVYTPTYMSWPLRT